MRRRTNAIKELSGCADARMLSWFGHIERTDEEGVQGEW